MSFPDPKEIIDNGMAVMLVATIMGWLPVIATTLGIVWYAIRIYDYFKNKRKRPPLE